MSENKDDFSDIYDLIGDTEGSEQDYSLDDILAEFGQSNIKSAPPTPKKSPPSMTERSPLQSQRPAPAVRPKQPPQERQIENEAFEPHEHVSVSRRSGPRGARPAAAPRPASPYISDPGFQPPGAARQPQKKDSGPQANDLPMQKTRGYPGGTGDVKGVRLKSGSDFVQDRQQAEPPHKAVQHDMAFEIDQSVFDMKDKDSEVDDLNARARSRRKKPSAQKQDGFEAFESQSSKDDFHRYFGKKRIESDLEMTRRMDQLEFDDEAKKPFYSALLDRFRPKEKGFTSDSVPLDKAERSAFSFLRVYRLRSLCLSALSVLMLYILLIPKLDLPAPAILVYFRQPYWYLMINALIQVAAMLMSLDVMIVGAKGFLCLRPRLESAAFASSVVTLLHLLSKIFFPGWSFFLPYSSIAVISLAFTSWGIYLRQRARQRTYKVASMITEPLAVNCDDDVYGGKPCFVRRRVDEVRYFVNKTEQEDVCDRVLDYLVPLVLVASFILAVLSSFGKGHPERFLWSFAAIISGGTSFSAAMAFNLPFARIAKKLSHSGIALAGGSAADELSKQASIIVKDTDLFPAGTITRNGFKILNGHALESVISCTASLIKASGSGLTSLFEELASEQNSRLLPVSNLEHFDTGGIGGDIGDRRVLVGNAGFMLKNGISTPKGVNIKNAVFTAINQNLAAVFAVNYTASPAIKHALATIVSQKIMPVFAVRDFNISRPVLDSRFRMSSDISEYPSIGERLRLSDLDDEKLVVPAAVFSREGLQPYFESIVASRKLRKISSLNLIFSILGSLIGILIVFFMVFSYSAHSPAHASPANLMIFLSMWTLPVLLISNWVSYY